MMKSWNKLFEQFKENYNLDLVEQKITDWIDCRFFGCDIFSFSKSVNCHFDSNGGTSSFSDTDKNLDLIVKFDLLKQNYEDIQFSISCLSEDDFDKFYELFVDVGKKKIIDQFAKEDLLVKIAINDPDYILSTELKIGYEEMKKEYLENFSSIFEKIYDNFERLLEFNELIPIKWKDVGFENLHGKRFYRKRLIVYGYMYAAQIIDISDFRWLTTSICTGKSYFKFLTNGELKGAEFYETFF